MAIAGYVLANSITVPSATAIAVTNNGGGPTAVTLTAGTYTIVSLCTMLQTVLTAQRAPSAGVWAVSVSTTTGLVTISMSSGTFTITWTSTDLRDLLGYTATLTTQTSATGTNQAKGIWIPDCTLASDIDLRHAPVDTKGRSSVSPTGVLSSARGPYSYVHTGLKWDHVSAARTWTLDETTVNASYETFAKDALLNLGHAWFPFMGKVTIVDHRSITAGTSLAGWYVAGLPELHTIRMTQPGFAGWLSITWPTIVSDG